MPAPACRSAAGQRRKRHGTGVHPGQPLVRRQPLNGAWLLGNAQAQDDHKDPDAIDRSALSGSALDRFTSQLESRLLSQMLSNIEQGKEGVLTTDDFIIHISTTIWAT